MKHLKENQNAQGRLDALDELEEQWGVYKMKCDIKENCPVFKATVGLLLELYNEDCWNYLDRSITKKVNVLEDAFDEMEFDIIEKMED